MVENVQYYHNMQYQVDPMDRTPENGQKPRFWLSGSFKNAFLQIFSDPAWSGNVAKCWETFSTIEICNIRKRPKISFLALFCINYVNHAQLAS